jgi:hypothetical protein
MAEDLKVLLDKLASGEEQWFCAKHYYTPTRTSRPAKGCADCWRVFYWTLYAKAQAKDVAEGTDFEEGITMAMKHMVEHIEKGTWDMVFQKHPTIEHIKEN